MTLTRTKLTIAVLLSLSVHAAGALIFIRQKDDIKIAGGGATAELVIGTAFEDSLMAGQIDEVLEYSDPAEDIPFAKTPPAQTQVDQTDLIEVDAPAPTPATQTPITAVASSMEAVLEPVAPQSLTPSAAMANQTPVLTPVQPADIKTASSLVPAVSDPVQPNLPDSQPLTAVTEIASVQSTASTAPPITSELTAEPEQEFVLPETVPVPVACPTPPKPRKETAKAAAQPKQQTAKPDKSKNQRASAKPKKAGHGGAAKATNSKASSGQSAKARATAAGNAAASNYPGKIASKLRRALRYPREAKKKRIRGEVVVSFVIRKDGGASSIRIARSSGSQLLDDAAKQAVSRAAPFPPIPAGVNRSTWPFSVPLAFTR